MENGLSVPDHNGNTSDPKRIGRLSTADLPPPPKRRECKNNHNELENEDNTNKIVLKYPHKDTEESAPSDYDAEEMLEQLQREYDAKHNPHRNGKKAQGIQWSEDDGDELTDETEENSLNASEQPTTDPAAEQEKDDDIDIAYNWNAALSKIKAKKQRHPGKASINWVNGEEDGVLDSDDSLNDSEGEGEEQKQEQNGDEDVNLAQYQKHVYNNDQPLMSIKRKEIDDARENGFSTKRQAIDWDEDDFDSDSLSDQTEESKEEKEYKQKATPSTKREKFNPKDDEEDVMKELAFINEGYVILRLFQPFEEYVDWKCDDKGKGIYIDKVKRNRNGKKLFIKYGFNSEQKWYVESIDAEKVNKKLKKNINMMLNGVDLKEGYQVVFKKPLQTQTVSKRKVPKKTLITTNANTNAKKGKKAITNGTATGAKNGGKKPVRSVYIKKKAAKGKSDKSKSKTGNPSNKTGKTRKGNNTSSKSKKKLGNGSNRNKKTKPKPLSK